MPDRKILFRGKRLDNGEWEQGSLISFEDGGKAILPSKSNVLQRRGDKYLATMNCCEVDPSTVSQYTGLTDKNGTRIFEGDILDENGEHFTVVYDTKWAKFKLQYTHAIQYPEWNRGVLMEVIGNRWDDPELMVDMDKKCGMRIYEQM